MARTKQTARLVRSSASQKKVDEEGRQGRIKLIERQITITSAAIDGTTGDSDFTDAILRAILSEMSDDGDGEKGGSGAQFVAVLAKLVKSLEESDERYRAEYRRE